MRDYNKIHRTPYIQESNNIGYSTISVLPELIGTIWDENALGYVHSLRPSSIRVIPNNRSIDLYKPLWHLWRVTVNLAYNKTIKSVNQEVEVWLSSKYGLNEIEECLI